MKRKILITFGCLVILGGLLYLGGRGYLNSQREWKGTIVKFSACPGMACYELFNSSDKVNHLLISGDKVDMNSYQNKYVKIKGVETLDGDKKAIKVEDLKEITRELYEFSK